MTLAQANGIATFEDIPTYGKYNPSNPRPYTPGAGMTEAQANDIATLENAPT